MVSIESALLEGRDSGPGPAALWPAPLSPPAPVSITVSIGIIGKGSVSVKPCNKGHWENVWHQRERVESNVEEQVYFVLNDF